MVKEVLEVMKQLARSGMTMLVVTHEMSFARDVSDRVLFLDKGCIAADASPAEFFGAQQNERIRGFLGQIAH
jgi:polar amino acid transport system ATP-binding protein